MESDCPSFGVHRFYIAGKTYTEFKPVLEGDLFTRTEYAILSCQCGSVKRVVVKDA